MQNIEGCNILMFVQLNAVYTVPLKNECLVLMVARSRNHSAVKFLGKSLREKWGELIWLLDPVF